MITTKEDIKAAFNRVSDLSAMRQSAEEICRKLSAEFHATFYSNKNDVWMSYTNENGKQDSQKMGTFA